MAEIDDIRQNITDLGSLKDLVRAYEQIASHRMKKTREDVLYNRKYMYSINEIFEEVRASYIHMAKKLLKKKKGEKVTFLAHNGKTVAVLLSANTGLYGDIVKRTYNQFMEEINRGGSEVTIIGKHGLSLFLGAKPNHPYTFFNLPEVSIETRDLAPIINHIVQYEEIHLYHGKFISVIKQEPENVTISAQVEIDDATTEKKSYLFEPSLEEILMFFETEIFASLFEQAVHESQLAKFASRVLAMDKADSNIRERLSKLNLMEMKARHRQSNRKQLNSLTPKFLINQ